MLTQLRYTFETKNSSLQFSVKQAAHNVVWYSCDEVWRIVSRSLLVAAAGKTHDLVNSKWRKH